MTVSTLAPRARRRMQPPAPPDPVTQYALDVVAGRIVSGRLVFKACERHLRDLSDGPARGLVWDPVAAQRAIDFFPLLRHYKGRWGPRPGNPQGDPIILNGWQQFIVGSAFGWKRADGLRRFRDVYVEVGKKNGKTLMAAGIGLLLAFFDDEPGAEVYFGATKRDQAKIGWNDAVQMVKKNLGLRGRIKVGASALSRQAAAQKCQPLGKDSDTDQGINVHGAIVDELHVHDDRDLIDNLETATSARTQPMIVKITTAGVKRESVWADERADAVAIIEGRATDDSTFAIIFTLDEGDDPFDEAVWPKANPNLNVSVMLETLREQAAKAKRSPAAQGAFLRFRMNIPTAVSTRAIDIDEWDLCDGNPEGLPYDEWVAAMVPAGAGGYEGLDLASVKDLTALVLLFRVPGEEEDAQARYVIVARFWCPEDGILQRSRNDGVPYADWVRDGYLLATPGNVTDYSFVRAEQLALAERYAIGDIGFDKWNATQLVTDLMADGAQCTAIPQTHAGLGPAWRELEKLILEHRILHGGHPILRWMAGNVEVETDPAGNQKPSKRRSSERIDGFVALDMALNRWLAYGEAPGIWTAA
jgi:phage terminase large subunit-like protein